MTKTWTPEQQQIIDLDSGQHLVLAPPGTGKTDILAERLSMAIKSGIDQEKIVCLTFTNRAAKQMNDRAAKIMADQNKAFIGNIHSFCSKFLRKHNAIPQISTLLDDEDVTNLINELMSELVYEKEVIDSYGQPHIQEIDERPIIGKRGQKGFSTQVISNSDLLKYNSYLKQKSFDFEESICEVIDFEFGHPYVYTDEECQKYKLMKYELNEGNLELRRINTEKAQELCKKYETIKSESNFLDFEDLLILTCNFLNKNPLSSNDLIEWIQLDEAQDINPLQWAIINQISSKESSHRVFFGDREQAIFSFLGSSLANLQRIEKECESHYFSVNHRSPQFLLDLYVEYAESELGVKWPLKPTARKKQEKLSNSLQLVFFKTVREEIYYGKVKAHYANQFLEANEIVENVYHHYSKDDGSSAILLRTNKQADLYGNTFKNFYPSLAVFKISGVDLFSLKITKDLMGVLTAITDDRNKVAWIRNLAVFGGETLKASRPIINELFDSGVNPKDFLRKEPFNESCLDDFYSIYKNERVIVFDTETTGLNEDRQDDIIQIAAREVIKGISGKSFDVYIDTNLEFREAEKVHKISKETLTSKGIERKTALQNFLNFIGNDTLIAHNLAFDYKILNDNLIRANLPSIPKSIEHYYDSVEITKRLYPRLPRYKLEYLLSELNLEGKNTHNAIDDVDATVGLIEHCVIIIQSTKSSRLDSLKNQDTLKLLDKFKERLYPLYSSLESRFTDELNLVEVLDMVTSYINDHINSQSQKYAAHHIDELEKLRFHMNKSNNGKPIYGIAKKILDENVHEYLKYKEADLFLEDQMKITIATIHKAKGLEFDNVYIPNCVEDNFPFIYTQSKPTPPEQNTATQEEARLLYVALTRAKKRLVLSMADHFGYGNKAFPKDPSRFIRSIQDMFNIIEIEAKYSDKKIHSPLGLRVDEL